MGTAEGHVPMKITDPASAAAAGICWLTRWKAPQAPDGWSAPEVPEEIRGGYSRRHGIECDWCVYPMPELMAAIQEFNRLDLRVPTYRDDPRLPEFDPTVPEGHRIAGSFMRLPRAEQRISVDMALHSGEFPGSIDRSFLDE